MNMTLDTELAYWRRICHMAGEPNVAQRPVTYVSGPISPTNLYTPEENITRATIAGLKLLLCGYYPVITHLLAAPLGMEGWSRKHWLSMDIPVMWACDRVLFMDNWSSSPGAVEERNAAVENNMIIADAPSHWELFVRPARHVLGLLDPFTRQFREVKLG